MSETVAMDEGRALTIIYRNWQDEISERTVIPMQNGIAGPLWFGKSEWHGESPDWFLHALDPVKGEIRDFRLKSIIHILPL